MTGRLQGRGAIITGAASGIGAASAQLFASHGAKVLAVDRPGSAIGEVHKGVDGILTFAQDIAEAGAAGQIIDAARAGLGNIDILFNNAGVSHRALAEDTTDEAWERVLGVNVTAMFKLTRAAIPHIRERALAVGRGRIINTASVMAFDTDIGLAAYTSSKHAVAGLTKTLALELGKFKITANYILPGAILTGMTRANLTKPEIAAVWEKKAALRRLGEPLDIARAALLLASDEADFITGHGLVADGGLTLRT